MNNQAMDFTISKFKELISALKAYGYEAVMPATLNNCTDDKYVVLRHDVDRSPGSSINTARIEADAGYRGIYYFRIVPVSYNKDAIREIASMGHEIGYHYEDLALSKGDINLAWRMFNENLDIFRELYPVRNICMHGSPLSRFDNRDLWKKFSYRDTGIECEPYFDINFSDVLYLTDTGRRWDGDIYSIRDRAGSSEGVRKFRYTDDIIHALKTGNFPLKAMLTFHPQRWHKTYRKWMVELLSQFAKNRVKYLVNRFG